MHKFSPEHAHRLSEEERKKILPPEEVLKSCGLNQGMTVVDVGCGVGYFTIPAAKIVGEGAKVYAIDVQEEMINKLKQKKLPPNVIPILAESDYNFPIDDKISDFTFLAFVVHENEDIEKFLNEIRRITKDDGRIVVLEWKKQYEESGPPYEERISMEELVEKFNELGFAVIEYGEINTSHYKIICSIKK